MTEKMTYRWLWSCLVAGGLLLLSGCSASSSEDDLQQPEQVTLQLRAVTRTDGAFEIPDANKPASNIKLFLATSMVIDQFFKSLNREGGDTILSVWLYAVIHISYSVCT